ncbi:hypothetical protein AMAG_07231 [Allomyces macrogynus ATCC 38327]|uniref:BZIP domain-containing protein n=1 Tax=Allomyces macrogynus (strain ATCC 38327) TaxID=578462 RepID=A0A0L0SHK6_ALLM3|nr:hypothetical protein AMAG_07231 [Allomyces macrogynus ATCC 38327]|eukprot:KNE61966.1 hypothetical protein AMAG_07231 [Allomyces macrogynus ATCC 38327]
MDARAPPTSAAAAAPSPAPAPAAVCSPCNPSLFPSELPPWHAVALPPPFPLAVPAPAPAHVAPCTTEPSAAATRSPARAANTASPTVAAILHASTTTTTAPASSPSKSIPPPTIFTSAPIPIVPAPLIPVPLLPAQSPAPDFSSSHTRSCSPSAAASSPSPPAAKRAKLSSSILKPSPAELAEKRKAQNRAAQPHKAALEERAIARDAEIAHLQHQVLALQNENAYLRALLRRSERMDPPSGHVVVRWSLGTGVRRRS